MLCPIIDKHVYEGAHTVRVTCIEAGATVTLRSFGNELVKAKALGGELVIDVGRPLQKGEELTAMAQAGPQSSGPSAPVEVLPAPQPLPFPLTETTLYIGGTGIGAWGALPGSTVKVLSGAEELGEGLATNGQPIIGFRRPLTGADAVQLQTCLDQRISRKTKAIKPVMPQGSGPYAEKLPPPDVKSCYACQQVVGLSGMLPGAHMRVFAQGKNQPAPGPVVFDMFAPWLSPSVLLGKVLEEKDEVRAKQSFDDLELESDYGRSRIADAPGDLNRPLIDDWVWAGERRVYIYHLVNSAKVQITVAGVTSVVDFVGDPEFDVGELIAGQSVIARQGLCDRWSEPCEVKVRERPDGLQPPVLEDLLYGCANLVRVAEKEEGSLVEVYVNGVYAGESKSPLVPVIPHLVAGQEVKATQRCGDVVSGESQPVTVKDVGDQPPAPVLGMSDPRFVEVSNLIPGARVDIFWNTLIIASIEATQEEETIGLVIEPWPGEQIHANQSVCMKPSPNSNSVPVVGRIRIGKVVGSSRGDKGGWAWIHDKLEAFVHTQWPVKQDLKVQMMSSDPAIVKVLGSGEAIIPAGETDATFALEAVSTGAAYLELQAKEYKQVYWAWGAEPDNRFEVVVFGVITLSPSIKTLKSEQTFDLTVKADPRPADGKVALEGDYIVTKVVAIPAGQLATTVKCGGVKNPNNYSIQMQFNGSRWFLGQPPAGMADDVIVLRDGGKIGRYPEEGMCTVTVEPEQGPPPPPPPATTAQITLPQTACGNYNRQSLAKDAVLKASLLKIKNETKYTLLIAHPVGPGLPGEPNFQITLSGYQELPTALQSNDILNEWGASVMDGIQCINMPTDVSFTITYKA